MKVKCPGCGKTVKAPDEYAGKFAKCPGCGVQVFFPLADGENAPPQFDFDQIIPPPPSTVVDCPYCSEEIKASAKKCWHCGEFLDENLRQEESKESRTDHPIRSTSVITTGNKIRVLFYGGVFLFFVVVVIAGLTMTTDEPNAKTKVAGWQEQDNWSMASVMMENYVKARLKAPSTADFPGMFSDIRGTVTTLPDNKYRIRSWVDSQNSFGAQIRTQYVGVAQQVSKDDWRLVSLNIIE